MSMLQFKNRSKNEGRLLLNVTLNDDIHSENRSFAIPGFDEDNLPDRGDSSNEERAALIRIR